MQEERELLREQSRAEVWPRVEMGTMRSFNFDSGILEEYFIGVTNSGVGPAIVNGVRVTYGSKVVRNWDEVFKAQNIPDSIPRTLDQFRLNGKILKVGEMIKVLNLSDNIPLAYEFMNKRDSLNIEVYYQSIYKDQWKLEDGKVIQVPDFKGLPEDEQFQN